MLPSSQQSSEIPLPPPAIPAMENMYIEWPQLVIEKILSEITAEESEEMISALLNCRLIDKYWNQIIEEDFMKKLTFIVRDPMEFLNLSIVNKRKVRSIKLTKSWLMNSKVEHAARKNFIDVISKIIEKVHFSFKEGTHKSEFELFKFILGVCTNVQELIVDELNTDQLNSRGKLFPKITDKIEILAANKIRSFVVNMAKFRQGTSAGIKKLLFKLPQLEQIKIVGSCSQEWQTLLPICTQLIEYINKFKSGLKLKKLALPSIQYFCDDETYDTLNRLLILCGKNSVVIDGEISFLDLNSLVNLPEISALSSSNQEQRQSPLFKGKVIGKLQFDEESTFTNASLDLLGELDIRCLQVSFSTDICSGQLSWVSNLQQLEFLVLIPLGEIGDHDNDNDDDDFEDKVRTLNQDSLEEFQETFSDGLLALKTLQVNGDMFRSTNVFHWAQYFPNLTKLTILGVYYTTSDIISQLTALESLSELYLTGLEKLEDITFTADCVNKYSDLEESSCASASSSAVNVVVPAVACFKSLKYLRMYHCSLLTNNCVINGIAKSKTLRIIRIIRCKNMTKECLEYLDDSECKRSFCTY